MRKRSLNGISNGGKIITKERAIGEEAYQGTSMSEKFPGVGQKICHTVTMGSIVNEGRVTKKTPKR